MYAEDSGICYEQENPHGWQLLLASTDADCLAQQSPGPMYVVPMRLIMCPDLCSTAEAALRSKLWGHLSLPAQLPTYCRWLLPQGHLRGRAETSQHRARAAHQPQPDPAGRAHQRPGLDNSHAPAASASAARAGRASSGAPAVIVVVSLPSKSFAVNTWKCIAQMRFFFCVQLLLCSSLSLQMQGELTSAQESVHIQAGGTSLAWLAGRSPHHQAHAACKANILQQSIWSLQNRIMLSLRCR